MANETPSMAQLIKDAIEARLCELHTAMPAEVVSYDAATGQADVKPLLKRKYRSGDLVDLPVIPKVPVVFPRTKTAFLSLPVKKGDGVLLVFSERSIDTWKMLGGSTDPKDPRKHALSDAIAIPGLYARTSPIVPPPDSASLVLGHGTATATIESSGNIVLETGLATFTITPSGKFSMVNAFGEFVAAVSKMFDDIMLGDTATMLGLQKLIMPTAAIDKAVIDSFKE